MVDYQTPIRRKLEACHAASEAWKVNHREAVRVFVLEDVLGDLIECGETLDRLEQAVIGELTASPDNDRGDLAELVQALRKLLLAVCESVSEAAAGFLVSTTFSVTGSSRRSTSGRWRHETRTSCR